MAHKKGMGSTRNGRDSKSKRLGVKCFGGQLVKSGSLIVRLKGTILLRRLNIGLGRDNTIFALAAGKVEFGNGRRISVVT